MKALLIILVFICVLSMIMILLGLSKYLYKKISIEQSDKKDNEAPNNNLLKFNLFGSNTSLDDYSLG
jgi:hypothetical protein